MKFLFGYLVDLYVPLMPQDRAAWALGLRALPLDLAVYFMAILPVD